MPLMPESSRALHDRAVGQAHLGARRQVEPGLERAVVAERDAEAGVGAQQAALADRDHGRVAARERAHDRGAAADVGAVADHDAGRDAALDHRGPERAGVEVDEALVHDRRALGEVRAEAHAVGVGDAHAGGHDVVDHARELVDAVHRELLAARVGRQARRRRARRRRPGPALVQATFVSRPKMPVEVGAVRPDAPHREQVQAQVDVARVDRRRRRATPIAVTISVRGTSPPAATAGSRLGSCRR